MTRNAMCRPRPEEEARIAYVGLVEVNPSRHLNALRWSSPGFDAGVLFASHLPIPWGAYWVNAVGEVDIMWGEQLEAALFCVYHCRAASYEARQELMAAHGLVSF